MHYWFIKEECIPVGCAPTVSVAVVGCLWQHPPLGRPLCPIACWDRPPANCILRYTPSPPSWREGRTHACENITFPRVLLRAVTVSKSTFQRLGYVHSHSPNVKVMLLLRSWRQWSKKCPLFFRIYLHSSNAKAKDKHVLCMLGFFKYKSHFERSNGLFTNNN